MRGAGAKSHIAAIHGFDADQDTHFLVLELVEGETLAERLRRGPLPVKEALMMARQIAVGLTAHIRWMSWINSGFVPGRPNRRLDFHRQNILNPDRCERMSVSDWKIINGALQFGETLMSMIQRNRSQERSLGLCV